MGILLENLMYKVNAHLDYSSKQYLKKKIDEVYTKVFNIADTWKDKAQGLLSVKSTRAKNLSLYPRFVTRDLLSSLDFWLTKGEIKKLSNGRYQSKLEVKRRFAAFGVKRPKGTFNYGAHLDERGIGPYRGYKQRIYNILDKMLNKAKLGGR